MDTDLDWVMNMNINCPDIQKPDLCIFLDLDAEKSKERIDSARATVEIFEDSIQKLNTIRNKFFDVFKKLDGENIAIIDASGTVEEVSSLIEEAVERIM